MKEKKLKHIETKLIHSGEPEPRVRGAVSMPIFQSAMFETRMGQGYHDIEYIRLNNTPNAKALHEKLAAIEGAEDALVASSGMAAISTTLLNFRPMEHGFDLSLHSGTKYLNGHSDIVAGAVIGSSEMISRVKHRLDHLGGSLDPHACFLLHRGMKTLALRMRHHNESALKIARFLEEHKAAAKLTYPVLVSHPQHNRAGQWFDGFSGMLSCERKGCREAAAARMT